MVAPNTEVWQWESGHTPQKEGEVFGNAEAITLRAEDTIKYLDCVALYGSGSTWNFTAAQTAAQKPSVVTCGTNATDQYKAVGFALMNASSGGMVTVKFKGVVVGKTNKAITCGDWLRPANFSAGEKYGCVYTASTTTGENLVGIALNTTEAPASAGTGTTASPFNMRPVAILINIDGNSDNK